MDETLFDMAGGGGKFGRGGMLTKVRAARLAAKVRLSNAHCKW